MNLTTTQIQKMQTELELYFSYVPMLNKEQTIKISFPEKSIMEKTVLRICLDCSNQSKTSDLKMMSMHEHDIKKIKDITGLKLRSFNAFVFTNRHTELVGMFE